MLRKFKIKVDGQEYQVEMEEIGAVALQPCSTSCFPSGSSSTCGKKQHLLQQAL